MIKLHRLINKVITITSYCSEAAAIWNKLSFQTYLTANSSASVDIPNTWCTVQDKPNMAAI